MKYAIVDNTRKEAATGLRGICPSCGAALIPKCGELRINHWSHKGGHNCDPWWENETEWHRAWKDNFPSEWQEVIHFDQNGEKHIADVKTPDNWVIEFQHSYLEPTERKARNNFYGKIVWVVNGMRRKTDRKQFTNLISTGKKVSPKNLIFKVNFPDECRLLKEYQDETALTFLDFEETTQNGDALLWLLLPKLDEGIAYVSYFSKRRLVELHNSSQFGNFVKNEVNEILKIIKEAQKRIRNSNALDGLLKASERRYRTRPRKRF